MSDTVVIVILVSTAVGSFASGFLWGAAYGGRDKYRFAHQQYELGRQSGRTVSTRGARSVANFSEGYRPVAESQMGESEPAPHARCIPPSSPAL